MHDFRSAFGGIENYQQAKAYPSVALLNTLRRMLESSIAQRRSYAMQVSQDASKDATEGLKNVRHGHAICTLC